MNDCPFCKVFAEKGTRLLAESDHSFVVLSDPRLIPGHLLVIPKRHVEKLSELPQDEKADLIKLVEEYQEKILSVIATGCDIRQNYRPFITQSRLKVNHLHFHLQPRENKDALYEKVQYLETSMFEELPEAELEHYKSLLIN